MPTGVYDHSLFIKTYCKRGHKRTPDNIYRTGHCKLCSRIWRKNWQAANPEALKKQRQKYRAVHSKKIRARSRLYYKRNRDRIRASMRLRSIKYYYFKTSVLSREVQEALLTFVQAKREIRDGHKNCERSSQHASRGNDQGEGRPEHASDAQCAS